MASFSNVATKASSSVMTNLTNLESLRSYKIRIWRDAFRRLQNDSVRNRPVASPWQPTTGPAPVRPLNPAATSFLPPGLPDPDSPPPSERQQSWLDFLVSTEVLGTKHVPEISPWGAIGPPAKRPAAILPPPTSRLNPRAAEFVPAPAVSSPPPPPSSLNPNAAVFHMPGSDILEAHVLSQFPPYLERRQLHYHNHPEWSRMLRRVQRANPDAVGAIQQFAESEKQRYKATI